MMIPAQRTEEPPMNAKATATASDVQSDVSKAIAGAEDMLTQAAAATGEKAAELRCRALEQLKALQAGLKEAQASAVEKGKAAAYATDDYVHENPWRSIVAAASIGVVVGLLIARR
jgi:ElaB/YqjD/DUF883 family membrane-anchored ribosome-binding protein